MSGRRDLAGMLEEMRHCTVWLHDGRTDARRLDGVRIEAWELSDASRNMPRVPKPKAALAASITWASIPTCGVNFA